MSSKNRPKFSIGDIVVIIMYGTVGTVTKLHQVDQHFVYEVNHGDILFFENALQLFSEYEGTIIETEKISIEVLYQIGDIVLVKGYGGSLFRIVGIRTEIWRYADDGWEELTYELTRMSDGEWLEATEDEMSLMISNQEAETFIQQLHLNNMLVDENKYFSSLITKQLTSDAYPKNDNDDLNEMIDELLDIYNDYKTLYLMFQDPEYKEMMNLILKSLMRYHNLDSDD
ncbi:hypothetical protein [Metabacillus sediminilitoris]|uniref:YodN n=1 Tax=Metabacillus sediminilitoris TaxID=2567941 RepID=A0A4S4BMC9_9BACI|nr:hypothetical protein [Metabacillus sediminilitoris]QGQ46572.1 hypothetical protein GMB29_15915 [Metabacillus sediminilitoris]THF75969.1 hypothetical protein E6W99_22420 [Metabacillus sediminilitoris]